MPEAAPKTAPGRQGPHKYFPEGFPQAGQVPQDHRHCKEDVQGAHKGDELFRYRPDPPDAAEEHQARQARQDKAHRPL